MTQDWRLLDTGVQTASDNVALDFALLMGKAEDKLPNTLRFLQFSPPAVLVGYHQTVEQEVREAFCRGQGIDVNRRITGGGAIYLDRTQLGWELVCSKADLGHRLDRITERICGGVIEGLKRLGVDARFRPRNDIEVKGRKISGTGGIFEGPAVLFQGTLLVDFDVETMVRALRVPTEKLADRELDSLAERVTCLRNEMGEIPPIDVIKGALCEGFEETLGVRFEQTGRLGDFERQYFEEQRDRFAAKEWIESTREGIGNRPTLRGNHRAKGGIIRASLVVDVKRKLLKQSLITGDFFISPLRTIFDLEASLKDTPLDKVPRRIEDFFESRQPHTVGLKGRDFVAAFLSAIEKVEYPKLGIPLEEANYLFTVNGSLRDILKAPSVLLLPYCAKLIECEYRQNGGCNTCGKCTVGPAYELAVEQGLSPITIQNYRHLRKTLQDCKRDGVKSYIGCCCEAFFTKRQRVFREIGIPGVLIDVESSTCYDLDREGDGLAGEFENQTHLKLDLLKKLIDCVAHM
jgi:lipoate-protein ligase A